MFIEILVIVGMAGLVSACASCGFPCMRKLRNKSMKKRNGSERQETWNEAELRMMIFTQGQCGRSLLPCQRDQRRIEHIDRNV